MNDYRITVNDCHWYRIEKLHAITNGILFKKTKYHWLPCDWKGNVVKNNDIDFIEFYDTLEKAEIAKYKFISTKELQNSGWHTL